MFKTGEKPAFFLLDETKQTNARPGLCANSITSIYCGFVVQARRRVGPTPRRACWVVHKWGRRTCEQRKHVAVRWRCVLYNKLTTQATLIDIWPCQWPVIIIRLYYKIADDLAEFVYWTIWMLYKTKIQSVCEFAYLCPNGAAFPSRRLLMRPLSILRLSPARTLL